MLALAGTLPARQQRGLLAAVAALMIVIAGSVAHTVLGIGGGSLDGPVRDWATAVVYVLVAAIVTLRAVRIRVGRGAWSVLAVGVSLYAAGNLVWSLWLEHVADPPIPSVCDILWLSLYPTSYLGLVLLARRRWRGIPAGVWLDGIVAGLGIATVGAAVVVEPVRRATNGTFAAVATNLAYPLGDLLLATLVVGMLSLRGWRLDRVWALLGSGFLVLTVADSIYLRQVAAGLTVSSDTANLFYMAGVGLIALAAWQSPPRFELPRTEELSTLIVPGAFVLAALAVLTYDDFRDVGELAHVLALLTLLAALMRTALAFRDLRLFSEARRQAVTDDLTNLPNRRLFQQRLEEAIAVEGADRDVAVLIVDLDRFKELNDTLGHGSGDELLRQIGPRLARALRPEDILARLGGDEFGIVLHMPSDVAVALSVADRIREALVDPFAIADLLLRVDASIGIALYPSDAETAGELLQRADVALYQAKRDHSGRELYSVERDTNSRDRLTLAADLAQALAGDEIELQFQPKALASTRRIVSVEALARWRHPVRGLLGPDDFVALAEATGLTRALTRRVMNLALAQCASWRRAGIDLHVCVNVTVADLLDEDLPRQIAEALDRHQLPAGALVIEVTESSVFSNPIRIRDVLMSLDELGVELSLDDFGTGFSSLGHLKSLPVTEIKIDRSFVAQMATNPEDAAIVVTMIQLAERLGKRVVAEGVDDEGTWQMLADAGCHLIQGYALSRPLPAAELGPLLDRPAGQAVTPLPQLHAA